MNENNLLVGTIDSWLIWNFTKGECHYTDVTNASRTMLYNINEDCWDDELLNIFNINKNILPDVKNCVDDFGAIDSSFFGEKILIGGVAGDHRRQLLDRLVSRKEWLNRLTAQVVFY